MSQGLAEGDLVDAVRCDVPEAGIEIPMTRLFLVLHVLWSTATTSPRGALALPGGRGPNPPSTK